MTLPDAHFPLGAVTGQFENAGRNLRLTAPFRWVGERCIVDVPVGFETDFNSVPRGLWNFFPPWEYPEAGVVHDFLYRTPGGLSRSAVDAIHNEIMAAEGASWRLRKTARFGLLLGGWVPWNKYRSADASRQKERLMPDDSAIITMHGEPIHVPEGPLTDGTKQRIEDAVGLNVPAGAHLAILALLDKDGGASPGAKFGVAWKIDNHWKLAAEVDHHWGGKPSGFVGIVGVF